MSPQLKLTYFGVPARAEIIRLIFHFGGVAFEDERVEFAEFMKFKTSLPLGQLPLLEVDGKAFIQSMAIARYAARITGLLPEDPLQTLEADMISETISKLQSPLGPIAFFTPNKELKAEKTKMYLDETLPKSFAVLESKVQGKYFLGDKATYADLQLLALILLVKVVAPNAEFPAFPKLQAVVKQVATNPGVTAYLASFDN